MGEVTYLNVGDTTLKVETHGDGEPIIFAHGGPGGNYLSFQKLVESLNNYKLVFYDQRGSGDSKRFESPKPENFTLDKQVNDIEEIRKFLEVDEFILLGHSWGGSLVTFYTDKYPKRVKKLIIYSGGPETSEMADKKNEAMMSRLPEAEKEKFNEQMKGLEKLVQSNPRQNLIDKKFGELLHTIVPALERDVSNSQRKINGRFGFWTAKLTNLYMNGFDRESFIRGLNKFEKPVLITYGEHEPSPLNRFFDLHDSFLNSTLVKFENSGHQALFEENELFVKTLRSFLEK
ncbi:MAG: alpha/beta fold hydrolase [Bdellovibrionales bacterium]